MSWGDWLYNTIMNVNNLPVVGTIVRTGQGIGAAVTGHGEEAGHYFMDAGLNLAADISTPFTGGGSRAALTAARMAGEVAEHAVLNEAVHLTEHIAAKETAILAEHAGTTAAVRAPRIHVPHAPQAPRVHAPRAPARATVARQVIKSETRRATASFIEEGERIGREARRARRLARRELRRRARREAREAEQRELRRQTRKDAREHLRDEMLDSLMSLDLGGDEDEEEDPTIPAPVNQERHEPQYSAELEYAYEQRALAQQQQKQSINWAVPAALVAVAIIVSEV